MKNKKLIPLIIFAFIILGAVGYKLFVADQSDAKTFTDNKLGIKFEYREGLPCKIEAIGNGIYCTGGYDSDSEGIIVFNKSADEDIEIAIKKLSKDLEVCIVEFNETDKEWYILNTAKINEGVSSEEERLRKHEFDLQTCGEYSNTPFIKGRFIFFEETPTKFIFLKQPWMSEAFWQQDTIKIW